jgi:hypothetical protein
MDRCYICCDGCSFKLKNLSVALFFIFDTNERRLSLQRKIQPAPTRDIVA